MLLFSSYQIWKDTHHLKFSDTSYALSAMSMSIRLHTLFKCFLHSSAEVDPETSAILVFENNKMTKSQRGNMLVQICMYSEAPLQLGE